MNACPITKEGSCNEGVFDDVLAGVLVGMLVGVLYV